MSDVTFEELIEGVMNVMDGGIYIGDIYWVPDPDEHVFEPLAAPYKGVQLRAIADKLDELNGATKP